MNSPETFDDRIRRIAFPLFRFLPLAIVFSTASVRAQNVIAWGANEKGQCSVPASATNIIAAAAADTFSVALSASGTVMTWGSNAPALPLNLNGVVQVVAGGAHCLALRSDGSVVGWGNNSFGQTSVPAAATNVIAVAAGNNHSLALRGDGTVVAWGLNLSHQCNVPSSATNVVAIAAGVTHSSALRTDGSMILWGGFNDPASPVWTPLAATNLLAISAAAYVNMAIIPGGKVVEWGISNFGQTGVPKNLSNVVAVAAGTNYSVALLADGTVKGWSQLIAGGNPPASATNVTSIAAGPRHCLAVVGTAPVLPRAGCFSQPAFVGASLPVYALAASATCTWLRDGLPLPSVGGAFPQIPAELGYDQSIYSLQVSNAYGVVTATVGQIPVVPAVFWGRNPHPQKTFPFSVTNAIKVACGGFHCLALKPDGTVFAWGKNTSNQTNVPPGLSNVVSVAAGSDHSLALKQDGSIIGWGRDWDGQIDIPASAAQVTAIAAGWAHSVALRQDGTLVAWGNNDLEQTNIPAALTNVIGIAAGYYHTLALDADHSVSSWGLYRDVPGSASNVVAIAAGFAHSLALRSDGTIVAWGDNSFGQTTIPASATNVIAISAGYYHSVALKADGEVIVWGKNSNSVTNGPGGSAFSMISAGEDFTLAVAAQGGPLLTQAPLNQALHSGASAIFAPQVLGSRPLSFQWFHGGAEIQGATNLSFTLGDVQTSDAGDYLLVVSNALGQISITPATLTVAPGPSVATWPFYTNAVLGQSVCLSPSVTGEQPLTYQWLKNGVALVDDGRVSGSASPTLCIASVNPGDAGDYSLLLTGGYGSYTGLVTHVAPSPIIAWGDDFYHELDPPADVGPLVAVASGDDHTLALRADGHVLAWGDNSSGQTDVPVTATNIVAIAAGAANSMALAADGHVIVWGDNSNGLLNVPAAATNIFRIAIASTHCIALRPDSSVISWGVGSGLVSHTDGHATAVAASANHSLVLQGGSVSETPFLMFSGDFNNIYDGLTIATGTYYEMVGRASGTITAYGPGYSAQGGSSGYAGPRGATNVAAVAIGFKHLAVLRSNGTVVVWQNNESGQTNLPPIATNLVALSCGGDSLIGLLGDGRSSLAAQSNSRRVQLGTFASIVAMSIGNAAATYQWQQNGTNIPGATNGALVFSAVTWTNAGIYRSIISDAYGSVVGPSTVLNIDPAMIQFDPSGSRWQSVSNTFQLRLTGGSGTGLLVIYASTNLFDWQPVQTNAPVKGAVSIAIPAPPDASRCFYRAAEVYGY